MVNILQIYQPQLGSFSSQNHLGMFPSLCWYIFVSKNLFNKHLQSCTQYLKVSPLRTNISNQIWSKAATRILVLTFNQFCHFTITVTGRNIYLFTANKYCNFPNEHMHCPINVTVTSKQQTDNCRQDAYQDKCFRWQVRAWTLNFTWKVNKLAWVGFKIREGSYLHIAVCLNVGWVGRLELFHHTA